MRPLNVLVGAAAAGLAIYVATLSAPRRQVIETLPDGGAFFPNGGGPDGGAGTIISPDAGLSSASSTAMTVADAGAMILGDLPIPGLTDTSDGGIPALDSNAPKGARFGIVLLTFVGIEMRPGDATPKRTKDEAKKLADQLDEDAKTDFHGAVQRGDSGSGDDLGRFYRGTLEPATEYALFSLPVGGVSAVVETPRGFWIAKRLD